MSSWNMNGRNPPDFTKVMAKKTQGYSKLYQRYSFSCVCVSLLINTVIKVMAFGSALEFVFVDKLALRFPFEFDDISLK